MKNCPKCNAPLADDAMFCNNCGEKLAANVAAAPANETLAAAQEKTKNEKTGKLVVFGIVAAVIVAIIAVVFVIINANAYKTPINKLVKLVNSKSKDVWAWSSVDTPNFKIKYQKALHDAQMKNSDIKQEYKDDIDEYYTDMFDALSDEFGEKYKMSITIRSKEKMKASELKEYKEALKSYVKRNETNKKNGVEDGIDSEKCYDELSKALEEEYDVSLNDSEISKLVKAGKACLKAAKNTKITAGYKVSAKVYFKGDDEGSYACDIYVVQYGSQWIIAGVEWDDNDVPPAVRYLF